MKNSKHIMFIELTSQENWLGCKLVDCKGFMRTSGGHLKNHIRVWWAEERCSNKQQNVKSVLNQVLGGFAPSIKCKQVRLRHSIYLFLNLKTCPGKAGEFWHVYAVWKKNNLRFFLLIPGNERKWEQNILTSVCKV